MNKTVMKVLLGLYFSVCSFSGFAAEPIKIAAIFAKTGSAAAGDSNRSSFLGIASAVAEVNRRGGVLNRPLEVIEIDNLSTNVGAKEAALEAVKLQVSAVIGSAWSSHSLAMAPVLQEAKIPMLTPFSTHDDITHIGDYIFRVCFADTAQGKVMANFARSELQAKTAVALKNVELQYSIGLVETFVTDFTKNGGEVLWQGLYNAESLDFSELLGKIAQLKPDVVFVPASSKDGGLMLKQAHSLGLRVAFLGGDGWSSTEKMYKYAGGEALSANPIYYSDHWVIDSPNEISRSTLDVLTRAYPDRTPTSGMFLARDAVELLVAAMTQASSADSTAIQKSLAAMKNFPGATGNISFDADGNPIGKDVVIMKFEMEKPRFIKLVKTEN